MYQSVALIQVDYSRYTLHGGTEQFSINERKTTMLEKRQDAMSHLMGRIQLLLTVKTELSNVGATGHTCGNLN